MCFIFLNVRKRASTYRCHKKNNASMIPTDVDVIIADQNFDTFWDWLIPILFCFPILEVSLYSLWQMKLCTELSLGLQHSHNVRIREEETLIRLIRNFVTLQGTPGHLVNRLNVVEKFIREISFCGWKCVRFSRAQKRYRVIVILVKIILA